MYEGVLQETIRALALRKRYYELKAEVEDRKGHTKDYFWNAGAACAIDEVLRKLMEEMNGTYPEEEEENE